MNGLQDISVRVEGTAEVHASTQNLAPVLHELRHALGQLVDTGEATIIDLSGLPFTPDDEASLRHTLGTGEVTATVEAVGTTSIAETAFAGIWWVEHRSPDGARLALHIEVAEVPFLLKTPREDLAAASRRLEASLSR